MATQEQQQPTTDPFAEFNGVSATATPAAPATAGPASATDPFTDFGGAGQQAEVPSTATPSIGEQALQIYEDYNTGFQKGVLQTVHGVGEGIRGAVNVGSNLAGGGDLGNKIIPQQGQEALQSYATPTNVVQKIGSGAEALLEMMTGEGALKSLSLAERLTLGAKIAKMADEYPILGKILTHGLNALRYGAATTGSDIIKGKPVGEALKEGGEITAGGTALGLAGEGLGAVGRQLGKHYIFDGETGLLTQARSEGAAVAQPPVRQALESAASNVGSRVGSRELLVPEIEKTATAVDKIYDTAQKVAKFDLKTTQQQLINTQNEIDELTATTTDKVKAAELEASRTELLGKIEDAKAAFKANGLPVNLIDQADALYKKESALRDLQKAVFGNEGVVDGDLKYGKNESIKVDTAIKNLQKLTAKTKYGPDGRLAQAIGKDAQTALMQKLYDARELGQKAIKTQELWRIIKRRLGYAAGAAVAGAAGAEGVRLATKAFE